MAGRILIVDQDPNYREILKALLEKRGYVVNALEDGYQIRTVFDGKTFDIIFLDSQTWGIRGKAFFAKVKKECPHSYIILFSTGQKIRQDKQDEQDYFIFHHGKS